MNIKLKLIIATLCMGVSFNVFSQYKHEVSAFVGGGVSTLNYSTSLGEQKQGFGGLTGIGYTYFFSEKIGIATGFEMSTYNSEYSADKLSYTNKNLKDTEDEAFDFYSDLEGYKEKQNAKMINIPLALQFQTGKKHKFYALAGAKIGLPVNGKTDISIAKFTNKGYYPVYDNWLETQEFMGFGVFENRKLNDKISFKTSYMLTAEVGAKWTLNNKLSLYTGAYADYGLNKIYTKPSSSFYAYNPKKGKEFSTSTIMKSNYMASNEKKTDFVSKIKPLALGIKIKLAFGFGKAKTKQIEDDLLPEVLPENEEPEVKPDSVPILKDLDNLIKEMEKGDDKPQDTKSEETAKPKDSDKTPIIKQVEDLSERAEKNGKDQPVKKDDVGKKTPEKKVTEPQKLKQDKDKSGKNRLDGNKPKEFTRENREILECITDGYEINRAELSDENQAKLDRVVTYLKENPTVKINCEGNTCDLGGVTLNYNLGMVRAAFVKDYLTTHGIESSRIAIESKGKYNPKYKNNSEKNRKLNRRVEITIAD